MWNNLASPPENLRYYKFTQKSAEPQCPHHDVDLKQNIITLFPEQNHDTHLEKVTQENSISCKAANAGKLPSSIKSTSRIPSRNQQNYPFDLNLKQSKPHNKKDSISMFKKKQKSSTNLSHKNQKHMIRQETSKISVSSKKSHVDSFLQTMQNQQEVELFSQILEHQQNYTQIDRKSQQKKGYKQFCQMMITLKQIRDINKEGLEMKKKIVRLLEERNQVSFLYDKDFSDNKRPRKSLKKTQEKSFKKIQEKNSTVKKFSKSTNLEERIGIVQQKLRKIQDRTSRKYTLTKTTKKSTSILR